MAPLNYEGKICHELRKLCATNQKQQCQVIIELSGKGAEEIVSIVNHFHGEIIRRITTFPGVVAKVPLENIQDLAQSAQVKKIWTDSIVRTTK